MTLASCCQVISHYMEEEEYLFGEVEFGITGHDGRDVCLNMESGVGISV